MAITNRDRVGKALEILGDGLAPFVERYRAARMEGSQPATTTQRDVDAALAWSDEHQKPFRADTEGRMREAS